MFTMLTDEQKKLVGEAFDDLDRTRKGVIPSTRDTLLEAARLSGLNPSEREMKEKMEETNFSEEVSRADLLGFLCKFEWQDADEARERLKADFDMFDSHKKGALHAFEIKTILTREGPESFPGEEVDEIIAKFVKEADGMYKIDDLVTTLLPASKS